MLKRTLFFGSPDKLPVKNTLLHYQPWEGDKERSFPLEDLSFLKTSNHN